jgi:hypothetical protein
LRFFKSQDFIISPLTFIKLLIGAALLVGCANQKLVAPSGAGVSSAVSRTGNSVSQARQYNDIAVVQNANAMTNVQKIDAKAAVIEKFWGK